MKKSLLTFVIALLSSLLYAANLLPGDASYDLWLGYFNRTWFDRGVQLTLTDDGGAPQGTQYAAFTLPPQANYGYSGEFLPLQNKTDYVFSCWIKATGKATGRLGVVNSHWKDTQFHDFTLTGEWTRIQVPFQPQFTDDYWLLLDIYSQDDAPQQVAFDAVQLETGTAATAFTTAGLLTAIQIPSDDNKVFFPEETPVLHIATIDRQGESPRPLSWSLQVTDWQGKTLVTETADCEWKEDRSFHLERPLPVQGNGLYTVRATWRERDGSVLDERLDSYAVVPHPRTIDPSVLPYSGVNCAAPRGVDRLGVRWVEVDAWWSTLQPEHDRYDFDFTLQTIREYKVRGYQVKFTLVHLPCTPYWAWRPDEVDEAKSWGFEPNYRFRPTEESIPMLEKMFTDFLTQAAPFIDLVELGGEDELIGGAEPYYRKKYPEFIQNGCVNGPVCESIAQMVNACIRAARKVCPEKPVTVGRPSGGDCYANNFGFSRNVLKDLTEPYDYFGMDCYTYQMRYLDYANMPNIGSPNRDFQGIFERARAVTANLGKGQPPFVSEYGFAIDNRLAPDDPLQQEETSRMLASTLTAKLLGSPFFFWFNTFGCVESGVFDYGMWHEQTPMLLIPAMAQVTQVVEGVLQTASRLGTAESNLKLGLFGQRDRAILALWTDRTPNPLRLEIPAGARRVDFLGNPAELPADGLFTATPLPIYIVLDGETAFEQLKDTLENAKDLAFRYTPELKLMADNRATLVIQGPAEEDDCEIQCAFAFDDSPETTIAKNTGEPMPWIIPLEITDNPPKTLKVTIHDNSGQSRTTLLPMSFTPLKNGRNLMATFGNERQDIVPPDPWIQWSGKNDLGGEIYLTCNQDTITVEAVISDDRHCHNSPITKLWEGDCFQVAFVPQVHIAPGAPNAGYDSADSEFVFAQTATEGPQWMSYAKQYPATPELTITRDDSAQITTYRVVFERKLLGLDKAGQFFRFCCVVFDDDEGGGQSYYYQLSPGVTVIKAPGLFPIYRLP